MRSRIRDNNEDDDDDSVRKQFVAQRFELLWQVCSLIKCPGCKGIKALVKRKEQFIVKALFAQKSLS